MDNAIAKIISGVFKPFLLPMMPSLFEDFDKLECDFATIYLEKGKVELGTMKPFEIKSSKDWDLLENIETVKVFGQTIDRTQATDLVVSLRIERFAKETVITAKTKLEEIQDVKITYQNPQIWQEAKKQQQRKLDSTDQRKLPG